MALAAQRGLAVAARGLREHQCHTRGGNSTLVRAISSCGTAPATTTAATCAFPSLQTSPLNGLSGLNGVSVGRIRSRCQSHLYAGVRSRGFAAASGGASEGGANPGSSGSGSGSGQSESDRRFDESGEYDTQERYKRVGNPISWANPTGGGTAEDTSSKHWRWIFPAGVSLILVGCLWSRRKALRKEQEESLIQAPDIRVPETRNFTTPPPAPPPPVPPPGYEPAYPGTEPAYPAPDAEASGGNFSFSPPPQSGTRSGW
mmetsp:Transcript_18335/g.35927  ORF Transcript_18335/g.35927 Transcript_18335/m.35927 type:complete len:259 (-) Transcript_18335:10-786(-)